MSVLPTDSLWLVMFGPIISYPVTGFEVVAGI